MRYFGLVLVLVLLGSSHAQPAAEISLRSARLSAAMKQELAVFVRAKIEEDGELKAAERNRIAFDAHISFLQLRRDAPPAMLIEPSDEARLCAGNGNGNCPSWLFQQVRGHAVFLLEDHGQGLTMAAGSHNGMRDLVSVSRVGHTPLDVVTVELHFDGKTYQEAICSESISGEDEDDTGVEIPPHPCNTPGQRRVKR